MLIKTNAAFFLLNKNIVKLLSTDSKKWNLLETKQKIIINILNLSPVHFRLYFYLFIWLN